MSDFENIQLGDKVFWRSRFDGMGIYPVTRVTAKQFAIIRKFPSGNIECMYWKKNGKAVGNDDPYNTDQVQILTPQLQNTYDLEKLTRRAISLRDNMKIPKEKDKLEKLVAALEQFAA